MASLSSIIAELERSSTLAFSSIPIALIAAVILAFARAFDDRVVAATIMSMAAVGIVGAGHEVAFELLAIMLASMGLGFLLGGESHQETEARTWIVELGNEKYCIIDMIIDMHFLILRASPICK
ncbi:MAG TPA: hypothetical protein EYH08_01460 [Pyrodictium sp.]|nr:hypothetical protein [Pyrodictium sp.]